MQSSLDKLNIKNFSFEEPSFDKNNIKVDNKKEDNIYKNLGDEDRKIQLGDKKRNFRLV